MISFETKSCGRCGGSGHYSYCSMHGTTCFGCGGTGKQLTKRGSIARKRFYDSLKVLVDDVIIGQRVRVPGLGKFTVREITMQPDAARSLLPDGTWKSYTYITLKGEKLSYSGAMGQATVDRLATQEELDAAIAYQNTLTKSGKERKTA